jgi:hypothetical protein
MKSIILILFLINYSSSKSDNGKKQKQQIDV